MRATAFTSFQHGCSWLIMSLITLTGLSPLLINHINHQSTLCNWCKCWCHAWRSGSFFPPPPEIVNRLCNVHGRQIQFPAFIPEENGSSLFVTSITTPWLYSPLNLLGIFCLLIPPSQQGPYIHLYFMTWCLYSESLAVLLRVLLASEVFCCAAIKYRC